MTPEQSTIYCLFFVSVYFVYKRRYKDFLFFWSFFFVSWYFLFTALFIGFEGKILVGEGHTEELFAYIIGTYSEIPSVNTFCMVSLMLLHFLSIKLGVAIYIPSVLKGLLVVVKFK